MSTLAGRLRRHPTLLAAAAVAALLGLASASSHREAPFVTQHPRTDGTDFYMFTSYEPGQSDKVVLIANYLPLQDPFGGPNYYPLDPDARYQINIDNDGDALEDVSFQFRFTQTLRDLQIPVGPAGQQTNVSVPLRFIGPITGPNDPNLNVVETYEVDLIQGLGPGATRTRLKDLATNSSIFEKPLDNVGTKTIASYGAYADQFTYQFALPNGDVGRMFVGQRDDPFVVNLGEVFDLVNTNPLGPVNGESDALAGQSVVSLVLEIPKSFLTIPGETVIGGWSTAWLRLREVIERVPTFDQPALSKGAFRQVSRVGMPLVNEVVIGLPDKNRFNTTRPVDDAQYLDYVTNPTLPELLQALFGVRAPDQYPRFDLDVFYNRGFTGINANGSVGEMLRLDTATAPVPAGSQNNLGALFGDPAGFPNGRRPGDDVVDVTLRVLMGVLLPTPVAPDGQLPYTDGALVNALQFDTAFPFLNDPLPGAQ